MRAEKTDAPFASYIYLISTVLMLSKVSEVMPFSSFGHPAVNQFKKAGQGVILCQPIAETAEGAVVG